MINLNLTTATRVGLNLLAVLGAIIACYLGQSIFIPLVIAILLAALVWPTVTWLNRYLRFSWGFSCLLVVFGLVVINFLVTLGFSLAVPRMLQDMPDLRTMEGQHLLYAQVREKVQKLVFSELDERYFPVDPANSRVFNYIQHTLAEGNVVTTALWYIGTFVNNWLWQWVLVMFILLFLLLEGQMLSKRVAEIFGPSTEAQGKVVEALTDMAKAIRTYLIWRTLVNVALGVLVGCAYQWIFHLRQPWTWALLTSVACYVPYLGPIIAGIPPVLDAFAGDSPWLALGVMVFYLAVITLEGYVLVPVVMGRSMELNATTVMLACLFWELVWGLPGLFLAMPLMAALKAICMHVPGWRAWANLMSTEGAEPPHDKLTPALVTPSGDSRILTASDAEIILRRSLSDKN